MKYTPANEVRKGEVVRRLLRTRVQHPRGALNRIEYEADAPISRLFVRLEEQEGGWDRPVGLLDDPGCARQMKNRGTSLVPETIQWRFGEGFVCWLRKLTQRRLS